MHEGRNNKDKESDKRFAEYKPWGEKGRKWGEKVKREEVREEEEEAAIIHPTAWG